MEPLTLEQFTALMRQAGQDGAATALAVRPAAPAPATDPAALNARVVGEINALFQQETFRTALAAEIARLPVTELQQDDPATVTATGAAMERGNPIASAIESMDKMAFGLPLGSAFVGGFLGLTSTKLIDAFVAPKNADGTVNFVNPLVKVAGAWASVNFLDKAVGKPAAQFMAGWLIVDALRGVLPIDEWVQKLVDLVKPPAAAAQGQYGARQRLAMHRQYQLTGSQPTPGVNLPSAPLGQLTGGGPNDTSYLFNPR